MGSLFTKCSGEKKKQYVAQPTDTDIEDNVAPSPTTSKAGSSESNVQNGKSKKKKKKRYSSSDSDSDSDFASMSKYLPKNGGVIVKSTVIKNNRTTTIGEQHTHVHHHYPDDKKKTKKISQDTKKKPKKKALFTAGYDRESSECVEQRLWASSNDSGCFIKVNQDDKEYVMDTKKRNDCSESVGFIGCHWLRATCFRVGDIYIMTALHVLRQFIEKVSDTVHNPESPAQYLYKSTGVQPVNDTAINTALSKLNDLYVVFNYMDKGTSFQDSDKFYLKSVNDSTNLPFYDKQTDCVVLEISQRSGVNEDGKMLPPPLTVFTNPKLDKSFWFISHSGGEPKHIDKISIILDPQTQKVQKGIQVVKNYSDQFLNQHGKNKETHKFEDVETDDTLSNITRCLFHTCLSKGGSGSPGVIHLADGQVAVVTMLLHGYPSWYYSKNCEDINKDWPTVYCVEQGAYMASIYKKIKESKKELCDKIFPQNASNIIQA